MYIAWIFIIRAKISFMIRGFPLYFPQTARARIITQGAQPFEPFSVKSFLPFYRFAVLPFCRSGVKARSTPFAAFRFAISANDAAFRKSRLPSRRSHQASASASYGIIYIYIYIHITCKVVYYIYTYTCIYIYICMHACMYVCICIMYV